MKILHLDSGREMRGGQWQVFRLHRALLERGHASLLLARSGGPLLRMAADHGLPAEALTPLRAASRGREFDLIHAHDARTHSVAAVLSLGPLVVARRVAFPVRSDFVARWNYRQPRLFLAVSNHVAGCLRAAGVPEERIEVVYDGVPLPLEPSVGGGLIAPRTSDPKKGMALALLASRAARVDLALSDNLEADLPTAGGLVYLTESEGLGSGILLAMAHGVPVLASNVGGVPELIQDGVNGVLTANDPVAVAAAFLRLNRQMGVAARQSVVERFTVDHMVSGTLRAYGRVLG